MKTLIKLAVIAALCQQAFAQTLQSITLIPPVNGYNLTTNVATAQLAAVCYSAPGVTMTCPTLTWGSNNISQITVNSSGLVTGAGGATCVTPEAYAYSGLIIGHHQVLIECSAITSLTSRPETASSTIVVGSTVLVSAVDNNNNGMGDYVAYTTSDATKATVNNIGEVTGVAAGTATITATIAGHSIGRTVTITNPTPLLNTYYVRPGGGTIKDANVPGGQCDGTLDVDLAGSTGGHCAVNQIMYCFTDETSSSVYTGLVQAGDTCFVRAATNYTIGNKSLVSSWTSTQGGGIQMPSGTPANPTKLIAECSPSCSSLASLPGNRILVNTFGSGNPFILYNTQNVRVEGFDFTSGIDCNHGLTGGQMDFDCPAAHTAFMFYSDGFTNNVQLVNNRMHGFNTSWTGTPGPGVVVTNTASEMGNLDGWNFDNPFGFNGNRTDGFTATGLQANFNGCTECQPKTQASLVRDGSGHAVLTFAAGQNVNYLVGTNVVITGVTPSDLNGTFPVSSITFNQQSVTITGASCTEINSGQYPDKCTFTTTATPTFGTGAFVQLVGTFSPSINTGINTYEVYSVGTNQFSVIASQITRPNWPASPTTVTVTCTGTCTAMTANALTVTMAGSSESASVVGTASFVHPAHRCYDQGDAGANGDGVGSGNNTIGVWFCDKCQFHQNLQDGWDMLHSVMTKSTLTNSISEGNEGAPAKIGNSDVVNMWNDILLANCSVLLAFDPNKPPDYNQYLAMPCRANGFFGLYSRQWSQMTLSNITWGPGNQNVVWDDNCSDLNPNCGSPLPMARYTEQNFLVLGFNDSNNPSYDGHAPAIYFADNGTPPAWPWLNNAAFNTTAPPAGGSGNQWTLGACPVITCVPDISTFANEVNALTWNVNITAASPVYHAGIVNAFTPATDINGVSRASFTSIGALEPVGSPPPTGVTLFGIKISGNVKIQ